jgi:hypothetical protein
MRNFANIVRELKKDRKGRVAVKGRYRRKVRNIQRDLEQLEEKINHTQHWGYSLNEAIFPLVEQRGKLPGVEVQEKVKIKEYFELVEEGFPGVPREEQESDDSS